jgi:hypothetical protein
MKDFVWCNKQDSNKDSCLCNQNHTTDLFNRIKNYVTPQEQASLASLPGIYFDLEEIKTRRFNLLRKT